MNCQDFEKIVVDLASDSLMDAISRKNGLAHSLACRHCAARLADERVLGAGLRAFGESTAGERAPAGLKQSLLEAFDRRHAAAPSPVVVQMPARTRNLARWTLAAAAAIAALLAVTAIYRWYLPSPVLKQETVKTQDAPNPAVRDEPEAAKLPVKDDRALEENVDGRSSRQSNPRRAPRRNRTPDRVVVAENSAGQNSGYIPLTYLADAGSVESGFVVRVEVPRSTLIAMGLPMNVERSSEKVKADVLLGDNGVALGIRLVQ
jgi:hypothetical protein